MYVAETSIDSRLTMTIGLMPLVWTSGTAHSILEVGRGTHPTLRSHVGDLTYPGPVIIFFHCWILPTICCTVQRNFEQDFEQTPQDEKASNLIDYFPFSVLDSEGSVQQVLFKFRRFS